jgi:hypothetical protein
MLGQPTIAPAALVEIHLLCRPKYHQLQMEIQVVMRCLHQFFLSSLIHNHLVLRLVPVVRSLKAPAALLAVRVGLSYHLKIKIAPHATNGISDLNHVPCKFFRQGACQAGKACPFSHNMDPTIETAPCKYFSKVGENDFRIFVFELF